MEACIEAGRQAINPASSSAALSTLHDRCYGELSKNYKKYAGRCEKERSRDKGGGEGRWNIYTTQTVYSSRCHFMSVYTMLFISALSILFSVSVYLSLPDGLDLYILLQR